MREEFLHNLCHIHGGHPNPQVETAFSQSSGIPFVKMKDLGAFHTTTNLVITEKKIRLEYGLKNGFTIIKKGCILLPRSGSVALNHRAILGVDAYIVSHIFALEIIDNNIINNYYLYYYLLNLDLGLISNKTTGLDSITKEKLGLVKIPIPPIEEQNRIISILGIIDFLDGKRKESVSILNNLLRSVFLDMFGDPILNTKNWKLKRKLFELGDWKTGGTPSTSVPSYYGGEIPWFTSGELGNVFIKSSAKNITKEGISASSSKIIPRNSILIGMYDTAAFKMSINDTECCCNQAILYSKLYDEKFILYVYYSLKYSKDYYLTKRKGARQKNLNSTFIKNIEVFLPTGKEGNKLLKRFDHVHQLIQRQIEAIDLSSSLLHSLFNSYLESLFLGGKNEIPEVGLAITNSSELKKILNYFKNNQFVNTTDYTLKRNLLFEILEISEKNADGLTQKFINNVIELSIK